MILTHRLVLVVLLSGLATGCGELFGPSYDYGHVEVRVALRSGEPIQGASIVLYTGTRHLAVAATGSDGSVVFERVPEGALGVRAAPPVGYVAWRSPEDEYQEFSLLQGGSDVRTFVLLRESAAPLGTSSFGPSPGGELASSTTRSLDDH